MWYREAEGPWFRRVAILGTFVIQFFWREEFGVPANSRIIYLWQRREPHFNLPWVSVLDICIYIHKHYRYDICIRSDQISHSVVSDSLRPHESQHARPPCPSPTPGVHWDSRPSSQWCHLAISSSVVPFSSCLQSFPASGSFQMGQLFTSGGQGIGVSALASVLPMNTQDWFPLGWTGWVSLLSKGLSRVFSNTTVQKYQFFNAQLSLYSNSHIHT